MRAFLIAVAAAVVIAIGAAYGLNAFQKPAEMAFQTEAVRIY